MTVGVERVLAALLRTCVVWEAFLPCHPSAFAVTPRGLVQHQPGVLEDEPRWQRDMFTRGKGSPTPGLLLHALLLADVFPLPSSLTLAN